MLFNQVFLFSLLQDLQLADLIYRKIVSGHRHLRFMLLLLFVIAQLCGRGQPREDEVSVTTYIFLRLSTGGVVCTQAFYFMNSMVPGIL